MESSETNIELETIVMIVEVEEFMDQENEVVNLMVEDLDKIKIELSNSDVNDIKCFYDKVFEYIISEERLIEFQLRYEKSNLFSEVASDIIEHLNDEIKQSEDNFKKIIRLTNDKKRVEPELNNSKIALG
ncbi:hypothetical protein [Virgibacillus dokdonensis]|uniref:hypothetical protein n=1 Tax=Virgibacillus dokdonensis TaxID=302167 RepID=UPI00098A13FD|nr:hypothetical protein [Virgibacillus dokdonensis]